MPSYLQGVGLVFVVFSVGAEVIYINSGETRDEKLQLLLIEDGDEALGNDIIETFQESIQSGKIINVFFFVD